MPNEWRQYPILDTANPTIAWGDFGDIRPTDNTRLVNGRLYVISDRDGDVPTLYSCVPTVAGSDPPASWNSYTLPGSNTTTIFAWGTSGDVLHLLRGSTSLGDHTFTYYRYTLTGSATPTVDVNGEVVYFDDSGQASSTIGGAHIYSAPNGEAVVVYRTFARIMGTDYLKKKIRIRRTDGTWWEPASIGSFYSNATTLESRAVSHDGTDVYWIPLEESAPYIVEMDLSLESVNVITPTENINLTMDDDLEITNLTSMGTAPTPYSHYSSGTRKVLFPHSNNKSYVHDMSAGLSETADFSRTDEFATGRHIVAEGKYIIGAYYIGVTVKSVRGTVDNAGWTVGTVHTSAGDDTPERASIGWYRNGDYLYETVTLGEKTSTTTSRLMFFDRKIEGPEFTVFTTKDIAVSGQTFLPITEIVTEFSTGSMALTGQQFDIVGTSSETTIFSPAALSLSGQIFSVVFTPPTYLWIDDSYAKGGVVQQDNAVDFVYSVFGVGGLSDYMDFVVSVDGVLEKNAYIDDTYTIKTFPRTLGAPSPQWHEIVLPDLITQTWVIDSTNLVSNQTVISLSFAVSNFDEVDSGFQQKVLTYHEVVYDISLLDPVRQFHELLAGMQVGTSHIIDSAVAVQVSAYDAIDSGFSEPVHNYYQIDSAILDANPISQNNIIDCSMLEDSSATAIGVSSVLAYLGTQIDPLSYSIRLEEEDAYWSCEFKAPLSQFPARPAYGDTFSITVGADVFQFKVVSFTHVERKGSGVMVSVEGSGLQAQHTSPEVDLFTKTWDTPTAAKAIVEELVGTVDWQIVEWTIPAYRVAAEEVEPFSLAADIVAAAGGVIDPNPDGTILVRYKHPVAANAMDGNETFEFVTQDDILGITESSNLEDYFDKVRILDVEAGDFADSMEYDEEISLLTAYPSPWTEDAFVSATRDDVTLFLQSIATKETTDLVEFIEGQGSTSLPVYSITNVEWVSLAHGGGISFDQDSTIINTTNDNTFYGVANVTYTSRVIEYKVTATNVDVSQFLLNRE